ncbi:MAG TPA: NADPH-dependent FMN reductase [Arsenicitalea sp.]|jgi:NAD(P)H-dependent FMN reductase|nr:NADPH-dependent FMN reductase [Arsenicitalea sp.]
MKTAVTLSGSIRKGSYNVILQHYVSKKLREAGVEVNEISLADFPMPVFNEDLEPDNVPEAAGRLAQLFGAADIVFIASPENNAGATALIVNTISWLSRQKHGQFRHAVFGIGAVSSGKYGGINGIGHLRDSLSKLGALLVPTLLGIGPSATAFDESGTPTEEGVIRKVDQMVRELTHFSRGGI